MEENPYKPPETELRPPPIHGKTDWVMTIYNLAALVLSFLFLGFVMLLVVGIALRLAMPPMR